MLNEANPLLQKSKNRDLAPAFDLIKTEHFLPALDEALIIARKRIELVKKETATETFENVFLALEEASAEFDSVSLIYNNLFSAEATPALQALAQEISPKIAAFSSEVSLDPIIFHKIKSVYDRRSTMNLDFEQIRVVEKTYLDFVRNGALLNSEQKELLRKMDQEISTLGPKYSENVLKATNAFELWIENESELKGLPQDYIEGARIAATAKGQPQKWLISLQGPSYVPFMTYSENRPLREKLWKAYNARAFKGSYDNQELVLKIVQLRHERARLLGFETHADYVLAVRMARSIDTVSAFMQSLMEPSIKAAQRDLEEVQNFAGTEVQPWDFAFYSEKLKEQKYAFNEEELRPYFKLENVTKGVFEHARRLFGLQFNEVFDVPVYHPDVKVYEVVEEKSKRYIGLFYTDFFPRETKRGGAWMTSFREQGFADGEIRRPHVSIVCNFTKPTASKPSLLSYDEVKTLFHEFGHALHGLLSDCKYKSVSGTNVYWDFVELPSQIMENWAEEKEALDFFARHYETNTTIPVELIAKIKKASRFQAGWMSLRQLQYGMLDMGWHSQDPKQIVDVDHFETQTTSAARLLPKVENTNLSCSFSHIFAGGYSAGYYSYKWAEVLDADAFEYFKEQGLYDSGVAKKFREHILSRGGSEHPMELYKKFRGREPDPKALLRREGLI